MLKWTLMRLNDSKYIENGPRLAQNEPISSQNGRKWN